MRQMIKHFWVVSVLLCPLLIIIHCSTDQKTKEVNIEVLDLQLQDISVYQYGQSRETLTNLADSIRASDQSAKTYGIYEQKFIGFLQSDAGLAGKKFICRQLSVIGSEDSVPVLETLLKDPELSDMARYALERIPGSEVDRILRKGLEETAGNIKAGIINSLGQRKDEQSVAILKTLISDPDPVIANAAVSALGKIAGQEAIEVLAEAKDKVTGELQNRVLDSYLMCANTLFKNGKKSMAADIFRQLYNSNTNPFIRAGALRGLLISSEKTAGDLLIKVLGEGDPTEQSTAIGVIKELSGNLDILAIARQLPKLPPGQQAQLLTALGDYGDSSVREIVLPALGNEDLQVRIAALKTLAVLGNFTTVDKLATIAAAGPGIERETARESLTLLRGDKVNGTIIAALNDSEPNIKVELIRSLGGRYASEATEDVLKTKTDPDLKVRLESFKVLGVIAEPEYLPELVDGLINCKSEAERREAKKTVTAVALKLEEDKDRAKTILTALASVENTESKSALLEILGKIGDPNALPVLREFLTNPEADIQIACIRALSDWSDSEPIDDLLNIARTSENQTQQILALRGLIRLLNIKEDRDVEKTFQLYKTAMGLASQDNEKKMVLSGLAKVESLSALKMALSFSEVKTLSQESQQAVLQIAGAIHESYPDEAKECLTKIIAIAQNNNIKNRAVRIMEQIE